MLKTSYAYASSKDRDEPLVSPSTANDAQLKALGRQAMGVDGLPYTTRTFITWGGSEILKDQAMGMAARLSGVGLDVTTYAAEKMPHDSAVVAAGLIYNTGLGFLGVVRHRDSNIAIRAVPTPLLPPPRTTTPPPTPATCWTS